MTSKKKKKEEKKKTDSIELKRKRIFFLNESERKKVKVFFVLSLLEFLLCKLRVREILTNVTTVCLRFLY